MTQSPGPTVKVLDKRHIIKEKKVQHVSREKEILTLLNHPFFVKLYFTFQDTDNLCILSHSLSVLEMYGAAKKGVFSCYYIALYCCYNTDVAVHGRSFCS